MSTVLDLLKPYFVGIAIIGIGVLSWTGLRAYKNHVKANETVLQQQLKDEQAKSAALAKDFAQLQIEKDKSDADVVRLTASADVSKKKAHDDVVIPQPPVPPADEQQLVADLKDAGVTFKPLTGQVFSTDHTSLPVIWTWNKEQLRVPGLETKLLDTETALGATNSLVDGLNKSREISDKMLDNAKQQDTVKDLQITNLTKQVSDEKKEVVLAKTNGWIKVVIAVPVVYGITRAIHK
jgi:hypothetical protein